MMFLMEINQDQQNNMLINTLISSLGGHPGFLRRAMSHERLEGTPLGPERARQRGKTDHVSWSRWNDLMIYDMRLVISDAF
jgi:hypothetical protein